MSDDLRMGVIGCGGISRAHLPAQRDLDGVRTVAVCDIDEAAARAAADEFGVPKVYTDWRELIADDEVDAVAVLLPHHLHRDPAVAAAQAGKHVLVEKPMAISLQECDDMIAAAESAGVVLMVAQILRFRPANRRARELIRAGAIGEVRNVLRRRLGRTREFRSAWATDPKQAGGWVLYGFGAHEVDMILWLTDSKPGTVFAQGRLTNPYWGDYDEVTVQMELSPGAMATYQHSLNCPWGAWDCIVIGTEGAMRVETEAVRVEDEVYPAPLDSAAAFREQVGEFLRAVRTGEEPEASGRQVRNTMAALEAAKLSLRNGVAVDAAGL